MKKILTAISALIIVTAVYSCKDRSSGAFSGDVSTKKFMYQYADQRVAPPAPADSEYQNDADSVYISITLDLDLPQGNSIMAHRIREWVSEQVSLNHFLDEMYFDGNLDDGQAIADYYGKEFKEDIEQTLEPPIFNGYREVLVTASKTFENSKCVTWLFTISEYTGGAHGSQICYGATFRKSDGRLFGKDIFTNNWEKRQRLDSLIVDGLCEYFSDGVGEKIDPETLIHEYTDEKIGEMNVALPEHGPWFTSGGLDFLYQQYEIAPYAAGMPGATIPYEKLAGIMTPAAAALIK